MLESPGAAMSPTTVGEEKKCLVLFPKGMQQEWFSLAKLRPQLKLDNGTWQRKVPSGDADGGKFAWVGVEPADLQARATKRAEPSQNKRPHSSTHSQAGSPGAAAASSKQSRTRPPFPDVPLAPTYYPTAEEFAEPFRYIRSIRAEAEKYGICKVVPPPNWKPSWSIDSHRFLFDTRIQNIHQLQERGECV